MALPSLYDEWAISRGLMDPVGSESSLPALDPNVLPPYEDPVLMERQPYSLGERLALASTRIRPIGPNPFMGGGGNFATGLLSGLAGGYGAVRTGEMEKKEQTRQELNKRLLTNADRTRKRAEQTWLLRENDKLARGRKETPEQAAAKETAVGQAKLDLTRLGIDQGLVAAPARPEGTYTLPRPRWGFPAGHVLTNSEYLRGVDTDIARVRASTSSEVERLSVAQKEQLDAVDRKFEARRDILKSKIGRLDTQMATGYLQPAQVEKLKKEQDGLYAQLDSSGSAWSTERGRIVGTVKPEAPKGPPVQTEGARKASFWTNQMKNAQTASEAESIAATVEKKFPALFADPAFVAAGKAKRSQFNPTLRSEGGGSTRVQPVVRKGYGVLGS
jgi:hypothetical protein